MHQYLGRGTTFAWLLGACGASEAQSPQISITHTEPISPSEIASVVGRGSPPAVAPTIPMKASASESDLGDVTYPRCSSGQVNTPCIVQMDEGCFVRRSNCAEEPCNEGELLPIDCSLYETAPAADACGIYVHCMGMPTEGCGVAPCGHPFGLCLSKTCGRRVKEARSCREVREIVAAADCRGRH